MPDEEVERAGLDGALPSGGWILAGEHLAVRHEGRHSVNQPALGHELVDRL